MNEELLYRWIEDQLRPLGSAPEPGVDLVEPAILVERYYRRPLRWNWVPILGRALSVVSVVRQPEELSLKGGGYTELLTRVSRATCDRYSPWQAAVIGLSCVVLTGEPIAPGDDAGLELALKASMRQFRVVTFGLFRVNLSQEALAFSLRTDPDGHFTEPQRLADHLSEKLRRFVPTLEF